MLTPESPLEKAIRSTTIPMAWVRLGLPGAPGNPCKVPWREDDHPSLSIFDDDRMFKDLARGDSGDVVKFISLAANLSMQEAAKLLLEWFSASSPGSCSKPIRKSRQKKQSSKLALPKIDQGSIREINLIRKTRGLPGFSGLELLIHRGMFGFCTYGGVRCWILTDSANKNAQVRPLQPDLAGWEEKAKTLPGSKASWPIGAANIQSSPNVIVSEGGPDLIASATELALELESNKYDSYGLCFISGATQKICEEALHLFKRKRVLILTHNDVAGRKAALAWGNQLRKHATEVRLWTSDKEGEDFNDYAKRHWESADEESLLILPERITDLN